MIRKITLLFLLCLGMHHLAQAQDFVVISTASDTACAGFPVTFHAESNDVTATYQWFINGNPTGATDTVYTTSSLNNGDMVTCRLYFLDPFSNPDSVNSNTITMTVFPVAHPDVTIALTNGFNPGCPGTQLTFTATNVNGVITPQYQWFINGVAVPGATNNTYTNNTFANGDIVSVYMISGSPCSFPDTVYSNQIPVVRAQGVAVVTISGTPNPVCANHNVVLTASTSANVGLNGAYQWYVNGNPVLGATNSVFTDTFSNNDIVTCMVTDNDPCISNNIVYSNADTIIVDSSTNASITAAIISGSNPGCLDSVVVFAGTATNFGTNPNYTWLVNGVPKGFTDTFSTDSLNNGDSVILRVNQTDGNCYRYDTLFSAPIIMTLDTTPNPPLLSLIGNHLIGSDTGTYVWWGPDGNIIAGADSEILHPLVLGPYYAKIKVGGCYSLPSNIIIISLLDVVTYNMNNVKVYPNPSQGQLTLDWGTERAHASIDVFNVVGQGLQHNEVDGSTRKTIDLSALPDGNYFLLVRNSDGTSSTIKIAIAR